jgi:hypothetical protein
MQAARRRYYAVFLTIAASAMPETEAAGVPVSTGGFGGSSAGALAAVATAVAPVHHGFLLDQVRPLSRPLSRPNSVS